MRTKRKKRKKRKKRGGSKQEEEQAAAAKRIEDYRRSLGEAPSSYFNPFGLWDVELKNGEKAYMQLPDTGNEIHFYPHTLSPEQVIKGEDRGEDQLRDGWMVFKNLNFDSINKQIIGNFHHTFFYPHRYNRSTGSRQDHQTLILDKGMSGTYKNYYESWANFGEVVLTFDEENRSFRGELILKDILYITPANLNMHTLFENYINKKARLEPPPPEIEEKIRERFDNWTQLTGFIVKSELSTERAIFEDVPFKQGTLFLRDYPSLELAENRGSLLQRASLLAARSREERELRAAWRSLSNWSGDKSHLFQLVKEEEMKLPFSEFKEKAIIEWLFEQYVEEISKNAFISQGMDDPSIPNINLLADYIKTLGWLRKDRLR